jgi:phage tail-like protein
MPSIRPPHQPDPYLGFNFYVEWNGIIHAGFRQCSGLTSGQTASDYREGTDPPTMRKLPGLNSYGNVTLQRGITNNDELWKWRNSVMSGQTDRREISIVMLDQTGAEKIRWNLTNCWPTTWTAPDLDATTDAAAIETLELVHEGITVDKWS